MGTMRVNNESKQLNEYRMCMDANLGIWMTDGLGGAGQVGIGRYVNGEYREYSISKASGAAAATCSYKTLPPSCFPCQFIIIDTSPYTTVQKGVEMDGLTVDHYRDVRRVQGQ